MAKKSEPQMDEIGPMVDLAEFCRELNLKLATGRSWSLRRKISICKVGSRVMVPVSEITRIKTQGFRPALGE